MQINNEIKLDFDDVLIKPKRSDLVSRSEVNLVKDYKFKYSKYSYRGIPIIASNMSTIATFEMFHALREHNLLTALHKHYTFDEYVNFFNTEWESDDNIRRGYPVFYTSGITERNHESLVKLKQTVGNKLRYISIDVANGHMEALVTYIKKLRDDPMFEDDVIMAGTVADGAMAEALVLAGADVVRAGIGSGCLTADSRILMSNGTYKNIVDVQEGDEIITMHGTPAKVKRSFCTGVKKVVKVNHNKFYKDLYLTPDHKCYVGDLEEVSESYVSSRGYKNAIQSPNGGLSWKPIGEVDKSTGLLPSDIKWSIPKSFDVDISEFFQRKPYDNVYNKTLKPSYELGYVFGFYLGDGNNNIRTNEVERGLTTSGRVEWNCFINDIDHQDKLCNAIELTLGKRPVINNTSKESVAVVTLYSKQFAHVFDEFGKRVDKHLPEKYMCMDREYLQGLYDGLMDSDGHYMEDGRHNFTNTSTHLIELFGVVYSILNNSFPNMLNGKLQNSDLVTAVNESYNCRTNLRPEWRQLDSGYEIVKLQSVEDTEIAVPVYDLEIDDPSHSFIANNMIVHNSVCTTRVLTGVGMPQLSLMMEVADAVHGLDAHCVSDGGHKIPADIAKAFGAGADFVMLGGLLSGHDECGGEVIDIDGKQFMEFYGMSSTTAQENFNGGVAKHRASEGKKVLVPYHGPVENTVLSILGGLRSTCTYVGAKKLKELPKRTNFVRVNNTHNTVFGDDWRND